MPLPNLLNNLSWSVPAFLGLAWLAGTAKKRWREAAACGIGAAALFIFTYASGRRYPYYALVMAVFGAAGFAALPALIPGKAGSRLPGRTAAGLAALILIAGLPAAAALGGNTYLLGTDKKDMPQYRFAELRVSGRRFLFRGRIPSGNAFFLHAEQRPARNAAGAPVRGFRRENRICDYPAAEAEGRREV